MFFFCIPGPAGSHYTVSKHRVERLPDDGAWIQDMDTIHRVACVRLVYTLRSTFFEYRNRRDGEITRLLDLKNRAFYISNTCCMLG